MISESLITLLKLAFHEEARIVSCLFSLCPHRKIGGLIFNVLLGQFDTLNFNSNGISLQG